MTSYHIRVEVVPDDRLGFPWLVAVDEEGQPVLFLTASTPLAEVLAGIRRGNAESPPP